MFGSLHIAKRSLAFFLLAFVCLNACGIVCLAYCTGSEGLEAIAAEASEAAVPGHCSRSNKGRNDDAPAGDGLHLTDECCMLPTMLVGAALERPASADAEWHPDLTVETAGFRPQFFPLSVVRARDAWLAPVNRPPPLPDDPISGANITILRI